MLLAILNKVLEVTPYKTVAVRPPLPLLAKTIQVRRTRHAVYCWRSKDELISNVLMWAPSHGRAKFGRPARTYLQPLCADTRWSLEDLPETIDDRDVLRERVREIRANSVT